MGRKKGTPKTGGRKKETPNKVTTITRNAISETASDYLTSETFKEDFMSLDAKDRLLVITKLVEFVIPKYQSTSIDISVNEKKTIEDQLLTLAEDDE